MSENTQTPSECPATNLLQDGRRHFICKEYALAVEKLSEACEKLVEKHGEGNAILADSFYSYGEALLEMARMETPVLGNALKDVPDVIAENAENEEKGEQQEEKDESIDDETKEDIADKVIDALCEAPVMDADVKCNKGETDGVSESDKPDEKPNEETKEIIDEKSNAADQTEKDVENEEETKTDDTEKENREESKEKDDKKEDNEEKEKDEDGDADENGEDVASEGDEDAEGDENVEGDENAGENGAENEEQDVGYLQLAWEIIEVARTLFVKKIESESDKDMLAKSQLRIADCHRKLGEVLMERDEWTQAAIELQKCLEIETQFLDHPNRRVAETNFEIGVAFDNAEKVSESAEAFERSATILEDFRKRLVGKEDKSSDDDAEIEELGSVLEEIKTRIVEVKQKPQQPQALGDVGASSSNGLTTNGFGASGSTTTIGFGGESIGTNGFKHASENGESVKETQDITHLIRKRPKETDAVESPVKKVRVEATSCEN